MEVVDADSGHGFVAGLIDAARAGGRDLLGLDIGDSVESQVPAQGLKRQAMWLKRVDRAGVGDGFGEVHGVGADVGADVQDDVSRTDETAEGFKLRLRPFAVKVQGAADEAVVLVVDHEPVLAELQGDVVVAENAICQSLSIAR